MIVGLWAVGAYLIGGIPTSYLAARYGAGIDLRREGSGNLGATNLYRVLGLKYALPVALGDILKGAGPVLAFALARGAGGWALWAVGAAAVLGHVFPVYLRFRGGKGVATAAGVVLAIAPSAFLVSATVWAIVLAVTGVMSVASILATLAFPVAARLLTPAETATLVAGLVMAGFILFTHRSNLARIWSGTEPKIRRRNRETTRCTSG